MHLRFNYWVIAVFYFITFGCNPYHQSHSENCDGIELKGSCFERVVSLKGEIGNREIICFNGSSSANHMIIRGSQDTIIDEEITYSTHQNSKYLYLNNFTVFNETQINQEGKVLRKGEKGNISIAIESTKNCSNNRFVFDYDSYSKGSFMYKVK